MKKFDKFEYKEVIEMKTFVPKGGFITQNHASSQNLSSLGDLKPQKPVFSLFFSQPSNLSSVGYLTINYTCFS